jgi:integrase
MANKANGPQLRGKTYWINTQINGVRVRESLKTSDPKEAARLYDERRAALWNAKVLKIKPKKTFKEACDKWLIERGHKKSIKDDHDKIDYLLPKIGSTLLSELTRDQIEDVMPKDVTPSTRNRYRAFVRAVLRACEREWDWLERAPALRTEAEPKRRVAYLTREQAENLIAFLPEKYRMPVRFALLTGLRRSNVFGLTWDKVDMQHATAVVEADEAKAGHRIVVPLNKAAMAVLEALPLPREGRVWGDVDCVWSNTWKTACIKAGVPGFRFHDLRHTWASWHAMAGTPLSVLQELGGWHSPQMVQKYAHLSPEHLAEAAERIKL